MEYTISHSSCWVKLNPPAIDRDTSEPVTETVYITRYGEPDNIDPLRAEYQCLNALYDLHQTQNVFKEGDTFRMKSRNRPFARIRGVDIIPMYTTRAYKQEVLNEPRNRSQS